MFVVLFTECVFSLEIHFYVQFYKSTFHQGECWRHIIGCYVSLMLCLKKNQINYSLPPCHLSVALRSKVLSRQHKLIQWLLSFGLVTGFGIHYHNSYLLFILQAWEAQPTCLNTFLSGSSNMHASPDPLWTQLKPNNTNKIPQGSNSLLQIYLQWYGVLFSLKHLLLHCVTIPWACIT